MARIKNITDDPLDIPSLGLFAVPPGEIVEVPRASDFADSELWQVTATGTPGQRKAKARQRALENEAATEAAPAEDNTDEENPQ